MSDDHETDAAWAFPFRPSGADWDRLVAVTQNMERRKAAGVGRPADQVLRDVVDVQVLAFIATRRAAAVHASARLRDNLGDCWGEGFLYGVLFEQAGGTAGEHEPVKEKTTLKNAMKPPEIPPIEWPKAPDSATMLLVIGEVEARFANDLLTEGLFNEIVDVYAMVYMAVNRVALTFPGVTPNDAVTYTDSWTEGFMYGVLFQRAGGTVGAA